MKSCFLVFSAVFLITMAAGCGGRNGNPEEDAAGAAPYRILAIGNSFSQDAMRYMYDILVKNGAPAKDIVLVNAYMSGQSLKGHSLNAQYDLFTYERQSFGTKGAITSVPNAKLKDIIASNDWDYITLQQASADSGKSDTYKEDEIEFLLDFIKEHSTNPDVKVGWHTTWAYAENYDNTAFDGYSRDQIIMYNCIMEAVQEKIVPNTGFNFIIPVGTAIQNARVVYGDTLNSDGTHLNDRGRFIAGAMWLKQIYDFDTSVFNTPYQALNNFTITVDDMEKIKICVQDAFDNPFEVTVE